MNRLFLLLLAPFLIGKGWSEAQCPNLLATSIEGLGNFSTIVLGSQSCRWPSAHTATNAIYSTSTPYGYSLIHELYVNEANVLTTRDGVGALGVSSLDNINIHPSRDLNTCNNVFWTVTSSGSADSLQINMSPAGIVIPYIEDYALKFRCEENMEGSAGGVEVVVPTGRVTTIQIEDTYLIANLHFTEPLTINFKSYIVDLFISSSANVTLNGTLSSLGLIIDAPSTIFDGYLLFNNLTAGIKIPASGNNNAGVVLDVKICGDFCNLEHEFCTPDIDLYNPLYGCQGSSQIFNHTRVFTRFGDSSVNETVTFGNTAQYVFGFDTVTVEVPSTSCTLMEFVEAYNPLEFAEACTLSDTRAAGNSLNKSSGLWTVWFLLTLNFVLQ